MEIELRQVPPDDASTRPETPLGEAIKADSDALVAYAGQEAVGMGALRLLVPGTAEIKRMYVVPECRGAGIARRILEELERRAQQHGLRAVRLEANARLIGANRMYREAGYREIPDYNSNPRSDGWYEKVLA